ncbi:hypothetical protein SCOCK_180177 [Actinacidiphila cocklensis]|uniref:Uncharacterized protein n=1 Tax=Actinacidiphila cocklensis TaxID=887465 RepID=A0A9W4DMQ7_9ACTN|nr:hypothetical protein SCOCK_180177 [Actinacidiphila cocklensis]
MQLRAYFTRSSERTFESRTVTLALRWTFAAGLGAAVLSGAELVSPGTYM